MSKKSKEEEWIKRCFTFIMEFDWNILGVSLPLCDCSYWKHHISMLRKGSFVSLNVFPWDEDDVNYAELLSWICSDSIFDFKNVNKVCWKHFSVLTSAVKCWVPIVSIPFVACARLAISSMLADCLINQEYVWKGKKFFCLSYYPHPCLIVLQTECIIPVHEKQNTGQRSHFLH